MFSERDTILKPTEGFENRMCMTESHSLEQVAAHARENTGFPTGKPLSIILWHLFSLGCVSLFALHAIGKPSVLACSSKLKPYAVVFQTRSLLKHARLTSDRVIIFFGDSSVAQPPWAGRNTPDIPVILEAELRRSYPETGEVSVVEWAFNGARMFHYYCLLFEAEKYSPDVVIMPINWRSLGPKSIEWREMYAFPELSALVPFREGVSEPGKSVFELEGIPPSRRFTYLFHRQMLYIRGLRMWFRIRLGMESEEEPLSVRPETLPPVGMLMSFFSDEELFRTYANDIAHGNTQLRILRALTEAAGRRGMNLLFYITPIHVDEMRRRPKFNARTYRESVGRVVDAATSETSSCLNLLELLREEEFIDFYEHYRPEGNRRIALALTPAVHKLIASAEGGRGDYCRDAK
jgi:hypothetical protein